MADIFLDLRCIDYRSEQNVSLTAWRAYADTLFLIPSGGTVSFSCVVDSGRPSACCPSRSGTIATCRGLRSDVA
jgi:hypothetical protein